MRADSRTAQVACGAARSFGTGTAARRDRSFEKTLDPKTGQRTRGRWTGLGVGGQVAQRSGLQRIAPCRGFDVVRRASANGTAPGSAEVGQQRWRLDADAIEVRDQYPLSGVKLSVARCRGRSAVWGNGPKCRAAARSRPQAAARRRSARVCFQVVRRRTSTVSSQLI